MNPNRIRRTFAMIVPVAVVVALACTRSETKRPSPGSSAKEGRAVDGSSATTTRCDQNGVHHWCCDVCEKNGNVATTDDGMEIHVYVPPDFAPKGNDFYKDVLPLVDAGQALGLHQEHWACVKGDGILDIDGGPNPLTSGPPPPLSTTGIMRVPGKPGSYGHYCRDPNEPQKRCALPTKAGVNINALSEMGGILFYNTDGGTHDYIFIPCSLTQEITTYDAAATYRQNHGGQTLSCTGTHTTSNGDNKYAEGTFKCQ